MVFTSSTDKLISCIYSYNSDKSSSRFCFNNSFFLSSKVLIEDLSFDGKYLIGRTSQDVPQIDGVIYIENTDVRNKDKIGKFVTCKITKILDYDCIAQIVK